MNGHKRPLEDAGGQSSEQIHPSRKRRLDYTGADAHFAKIYADLADDVQAVRLKAARELIRTLSVSSESQIPRLQSVLGRLIKGLCSGRKAARLGFSIALAEVLRLAFGLRDPAFRLAGVTTQAIELTTVQGNVSGQEKRDYLLGRRFAFQAIFQSNVGADTAMSQLEWRDFTGAVVELMAEKQWLRRECGAMLYECLSSAGLSLTVERLQTIVDWLSAKSLWKTPEGVALWFLFTPKAGVRLPDGVWDRKNPLSNEKNVLAKVLQEIPLDEEQAANTASGSRQASPSFAWSVILNEVHKWDLSIAKDTNRDSAKRFASFWTNCVEQTLFNDSASTERKALGLQILGLAISTAPSVALTHVFSPNVMRCIIAQRADPQRYLFDAAKVSMNQLVARAKQDPEVAGRAASSLVRAGILNFDQMTKLKVMDILFANADARGFESIMREMKPIMLRPALKPDEQGNADNARRTVADLILAVVRSRKTAELFDGSVKAGLEDNPPVWLSVALEILVETAYWKLEKTQAFPPISDASRQMCRQRLSSCIAHVMKLPLHQASHTLRLTVEHLRHANDKTYGYPAAAKEIKSLVRKTDKSMKDAAMHGHSDQQSVERRSHDSSRAFVLLYAMAVLQVYNEDPDAGPALQDLHNCAGDWDNNTQSVSTLIELLLSFASKQSVLYRKLAEQVFTAFSASLTPESLQSMLAVLAQKENLTGQQELFRNEDEEVEDDSDLECGSVIDVEDMSDMELVNGEEVEAEASIDSEDDEEDEEDDDSDELEDEEDADAVAAFDQKLAAALGSAAMADDDDGSDMDDEQMMAVEPALQNVFKELKKKSGQKQDNKDAKDTIVSFKNRVLDLLSIYVKAQSSNILALDIIWPLLVLIRSTSSKPTAEKTFAVLKQYFEACNKNKILPVLPSEEQGFALLSLIHAEMAKGGSKLHSNASSRSSLFLSKVLVAMDPACYRQIVGMYAQLQEQWWTDPSSKIQGSVFTEWISWSIATRRQT